MNNPKVTIIIPVYKTEKYLAASVRSAIDQTYGNLEIILVDDGRPTDRPEYAMILQKNTRMFR